MAAKTHDAVPQSVSITVPEALSVMVTGDFSHWRPVQMSRLDGGIWTTELPLRPGTYHYRFLVDGQLRDGPECTLRVPKF